MFRGLYVRGFLVVSIALVMLLPRCNFLDFATREVGGSPKSKHLLPRGFSSLRIGTLLADFPDDP
jgi:hypothetical protein